MSPSKILETLYGWLRKAKEVIFLIVSTFLLIYSDEIKSFISEAASVDPLKIVFALLVAIATITLLARLIMYYRHRHLKMVVPPSTTSTKEMPEFYSSRKELPPPEDFLKSAKDEIDLMGFSLWDIVVQNRGTITDLLKQGKHIRFILLDPNSVDVKRFEDAIVDADIKGQIQKSLEQLHKLKQSLSDTERGRLDVRTHDLLPFHTIMAIDAKSDSGVLRVEYYVYGTDSRSWISLGISKKNQPQLFEKYWKSYEYVHEHSWDIEAYQPKIKDLDNSKPVDKKEHPKIAIGELLEKLMWYRDSWKNIRKHICELKYLPTLHNANIESIGDQIREKLIALEKANINLGISLRNKVNQTADDIINFGIEVHEYFPDDKKQFRTGTNLDGHLRESNLVNRGDKLSDNVCVLIDAIKEAQKSFV